MKYFNENCVFEGLWVVISPESISRSDFFGYRWYDALAKHIKSFFEKTLKWNDISAYTTKDNLKICNIGLLKNLKQFLITLKLISSWPGF